MITVIRKYLGLIPAITQKENFVFYVENSANFRPGPLKGCSTNVFFYFNLLTYPLNFLGDSSRLGNVGLSTDSARAIGGNFILFITRPCLIDIAIFTIICYLIPHVSMSYNFN